MDEVRVAHAGRTSRWSVVDASRPHDLEKRLERRGYSVYAAHRAVWLPVSAWRAKASDFSVKAVRTRRQLEDLYRVVGAAFGGDRRPADPELVAELDACGPGRRVQRFVVYLAGQPVCSGGMTVFPEAAFGFLWAGGTVPEARGRGAYRALLQARVQAAEELGLGAVGLYARTTTSLPIVEALGFEVGGGMRLWERRGEATD